MLDTLFTVATGKVALVAFAVFVLSSLVLGRFNPKNEIREDLGSSYISTDSPFQTKDPSWYDTGRVTAMLRGYDKDPDRYYGLHRSFILGWDLFYPLCYGIPSILLLAYFCPWRSGSPRWLVLLPLATMAFDYGENFTMLAFLSRFRTNHETPLGLLEASRLFTSAKWLGVSITLVVLLLFIAGGFFLRRRGAAEG
jgi:hypothetical protein